MKVLKYVTIILATLFLGSPLFAADGDVVKYSDGQFLVYVGTYTGKKSQGIYVARLDAATGKLTQPELAAETANPSFLAIHPRLPALYAAGRSLLFAANEARNGTVTAYSINKQTGKLSLINQRSSMGDGPCHVSVDATGKCLLVANYGNGSFAALPIKDDGSLGEATTVIQQTGSSVDPKRQTGPHAHWIDVDPANKFVFACDLGLDKIMSYKLDAAGGLLATNDPAFATVKPGSGPRHLAFHPNGRFAYVINEMGSTVTVFAYNVDQGALTEVQTITTLPENFAGNSTSAEVEVHPSGRFLYGSNRGHDSIAVYAIDPQSGKLAFVEHQSTQGKMPRNFAIDPTGHWLLAANQGTDNIVVFRINRESGRLTPTGQTIQVGAPVCIKFLSVK